MGVVPKDVPAVRAVRAANDPYRRRREAGEASRLETRRRLLVSADALFRARGYATTSVGAIATGAGVSVQTLYLAWGSKRALLRAAAAAAASDGQLPLEPEAWHEAVLTDLTAATRSGGPGTEERGPLTTAAYLAAFSRLWIRVVERSGPYPRLQREAAAADPDLAADWAAAVSGRRATIARVVAAMPHQDLRGGLTDEDVTQTLWALASPELHELLTDHAGRTPEQVQAWLEATLVAALCRPRPG